MQSDENSFTFSVPGLSSPRSLFLQNAPPPYPLRTEVFVLCAEVSQPLHTPLSSSQNCSSCSVVFLSYHRFLPLYWTVAISMQLCLSNIWMDVVLSATTAFFLLLPSILANSPQSLFFLLPLCFQSHFPANQPNVVFPSPPLPGSGSYGGPQLCQHAKPVGNSTLINEHILNSTGNFT